MKDPVLELMVKDPQGLYVDCTLGTGGHAEAILGDIDGRTKVIGIERDPKALEAARKRLAKYGHRVEFVLGNFRDADRYLGERKCYGFLLDLGLSTLQLSDPARGFSYLEDGPLDMAMGEDADSLEGFIESADEKQISGILKEYGEVRKSRMIARSIIEARDSEGLESTGQLRSAVEKIVGRKNQFPVLSKVFQAFRIRVNGELDNLRTFLPKGVERLEAGGRIAVISYHSLEDRIVKRFFVDEAKGCVCPPGFPVCTCGGSSRLRILTKRPLTPAQEELEHNPRSRSAKLRVAERIEDEKEK